MKSNFEPFWWSWFSAGGTIAAFILPVLLLLFGFCIPIGWVEAPSFEHLSGLVKPVFVRIPIFIIIFLSLLHWAHRFRFTLIDGLQLQRYSFILAILCYGSAIIFSLFAGYILWGF